jgi:hypothetical protein
MFIDGMLTVVLTKSFCSCEEAFVVLVTIETEESKLQPSTATHCAMTSRP